MKEKKIDMTPVVLVSWDGTKVREYGMLEEIVEGQYARIKGKKALYHTSRVVEATVADQYVVFCTQMKERILTLKEELWKYQRKMHV